MRLERIPSPREHTVDHTRECCIVDGRSKQHTPTIAHDRNRRKNGLTMAEQIGLIGIGIMGKPMARNLVKAGYTLVVHNRSRGAVDELMAESDAITAADTPRGVAEQVNIVITMLPDS